MRVSVFVLALRRHTGSIPSGTPLVRQNLRSAVSQDTAVDSFLGESSRDPILQLNDLDLAFLNPELPLPHPSPPRRVLEAVSEGFRHKICAPPDRFYKNSLITICSFPLPLAHLTHLAKWPFLRHTQHTRLIHTTPVQGPADLL